MDNQKLKKLGYTCSDWERTAAGVKTHRYWKKELKNGCELVISEEPRHTEDKEESLFLFQLYHLPGEIQVQSPIHVLELENIFNRINN